MKNDIILKAKKIYFKECLDCWTERNWTGCNGCKNEKMYQLYNLVIDIQHQDTNTQENYL